MPSQDLIDAIIGEKPEALARQGDGLFLPVPLYRAKKACTPVYIDRDLYRQLVGGPDDAETMRETLAALFSTTIEPEHGTGERVGTAYVDRQADPLDLSLSGNLGSGRAYYMGHAFNIKGEKTPLATSTQRKFSDGLLEMERAVWETLVANGLQGAIGTGLNGVLAIIDMNDLCEVPWRDAPVRRAKVIRVDRGCLDRVTHLFHTPRALLPQDLIRMAESFGRLEADKFCQRIAHGTWSAGNISPQGHLIDFDTVCAAQGRAATYSSTRWYHQNRFGHEAGGQAEILKAVAADTRLNAGNLPATGLLDAMDASLRHHKRIGFVHLMGFNDAAALYARHGEDIDALCDLWEELARKAYGPGGVFLMKDAGSLQTHVFDLSRFMAHYPLQARLGRFDAAADLADMQAHANADAMLRPREQAPLSDIEQQHMDAVMAVIGQHQVEDPMTLDMLRLAALGFVRKYDRLHRALMEDSRQDPLAVEALALARNEDRRALFPATTVSFRLAENRDIPAAQFDAIVAALIKSCRGPAAARAPCISHMHLWREGALFIKLCGDGTHRLGFRAFGSKQAVEIEWENETYPLDADGLAPAEDNAVLLAKISQMDYLHAAPPRIYSQNEHKEILPLTPL